MKSIDGYALQVETSLAFSETIKRVTELLKAEGFGVLTEIDVKATLKEKLDVDWHPYHILGACNPPFAHRALKALPQIGVLLPCNVVVWDDGERRIVAAMEPKIMGQMIDNPEIKAIADEVSERMHRVMTEL